MRNAALPFAVIALAAPAVAAMAAQVELAQLTIHERVIIRVPRMAAPAAPRPIRWVEKKGPKCIPAAALAGALVTDRSKLDLVLRGGRRVRAEMDDDCRSLDFARGFYLKPSADGMVCADRDVVRSRYGAKCPIDRFRSLEAKEAKR